MAASGKSPALKRKLSGYEAALCSRLCFTGFAPLLVLSHLIGDLQVYEWPKLAIAGSLF